MSDSKSNAKWSQHPVISTVLWMLGTEMSNLDVNDKNNNSNGKLNILTWKDDQGGNISEFMNQVQTSDNTPNNSEGDTTVLSPTALASQQQQNQQFQQNSEHEGQPPDYASPQWGFYVSITPPQQEKFPVRA